VILLIGPVGGQRKAIAQNAKIIHWKATSIMPISNPTNALWRDLIETINEKAKGRLVIEMLGPEAVPGYEQFAAVKSGLIQGPNFSVEAYYGKEVTGIEYTSFTELTPWEERNSGYFDFRVELLKPFNVLYLGRGCGGRFHLYTNKKVSKPQDLAGQIIRGSAAYESFLKALGIQYISLPSREIYTALERGVIDGVAYPTAGFYDYGFAEVTKYIIEPEIFNMNVELTANLKAFEALPKDLQELIKSLVQKKEIEWAPKFQKQDAEAIRKSLEIAKMTQIFFSPEDAESYVNLTKEASWSVLEKQKPDLAAKLKKLLTK
jgi:TRAP-type C4-dicarboxylate transport system substrate-binding protein